MSTVQVFDRQHVSMNCSRSLLSKSRNDVWKTIYEYQILPAFGEILDRNIAHVPSSVLWESNEFLAKVLSKDAFSSLRVDLMPY